MDNKQSATECCITLVSIKTESRSSKEYSHLVLIAVFAIISA